MLFDTTRPKFGLTLHHVDPISLSPESLRDLLSDHGVICFKNQTLSERDQQLVMSTFGPLQNWQEQQAPQSSSPGVDTIINLHNSDFLGTTRMAWHTDQTYRASNYLPVRSLYAYETPSPGNVTSFLDIKLFTDIITREYPEIFTAIGRYHIAGDTTMYTDRQVFSWCEHIKQHVFRLDSRMEFITKIDHPRVRNLIVDFLTHTPKYNHSWELGDFVIFDNNQCPHRRTSMVGECKLHRLTSTFWLASDAE
jgi:alpha-ketoglutarate-dependent taurine dioxygenase